MPATIPAAPFAAGYTPLPTPSQTTDPLRPSSRMPTPRYPSARPNLDGGPAVNLGETRAHVGKKRH